MQQRTVSPVAALMIDAEACELTDKKGYLVEPLALDPQRALNVALILDDCLGLWDDPQAFGIRVAAWQKLAKDCAG